MILNFEDGRFDGKPAQSLRTLGDLRGLFRAPELIGDPHQVVYQTYGCPGEVEGSPRLLYATTVLQPGKVGDEFFMTRGHFHVNPERGELMFTLQGVGHLLLMDRSRKTWAEPMQPGSTHDIDGHHAHRVVNTGDVPLIFLVTWMSDCGHDYSEIEQRGFGPLGVETL